MALIMVADDSPDICVLLKDMLQMRGHQVLTVSDGIQMVEKAKDWKPQIIIADLMMPGAYGSAAFKSLQDDATTAGIPVIFLTAATPDQAHRVIPESPKARVMFKPVDIAALSKNIQELLQPKGA